MGPGRLPLLRRALARLTAGQADAALPAEAERVLRSQATAARARRLRKLMEPAGPPERALTRHAMEQMRYLSREWPEEWPVARVARGFQVRPEVVRRVLRSRFCPSPERSRKQDARAGGGGGGGGGRVPVAREDTFQLLPAGSQGPLARLAPAAPPPRAARAPGPAQQRGNRGRGAPATEADWDGQLLSEAELEAAAEEAEEEEAGRPRRGRQPGVVVVQRGREFFDSDGNFLYRLPAGAGTAGDAAAAACKGPGGQ